MPACSASEETARTVALVPTAMKAGVSTAPCGVPIMPRRAAPSRAPTAKKASPVAGAGSCGRSSPRGPALSPGSGRSDDIDDLGQEALQPVLLAEETDGAALLHGPQDGE